MQSAGKRLLTAQLLTALANVDTIESPSANPLRDNLHKENLKPLLLTLHVLYPTALLASLDLLDRSLATRLLAHDGHDESESIGHSSTYIVRSTRDASRARHQYHHRRSNRAAELLDEDSDAGTSRYEDDEARFYMVDVAAWSCTCATFVLELFPAVSTASNSDTLAASDPMSWTDASGLASLIKGSDLPMCKHLLACVLAEKCPKLFGSFIINKSVTVEEICGWSAGWGG